MAILQDYWHHWEDVTVGFFLGVLCAFVSYRQHYPGIASQRAGEAFVISKGTCHALFLLPALVSSSAVMIMWLTVLTAQVHPPPPPNAPVSPKQSFMACLSYAL